MANGELVYHVNLAAVSGWAMDGREFYSIAGKKGSVVRETPFLDSPVVAKLERGGQVEIIGDAFVEGKRRLRVDSPVRGWITATSQVIRNYVIPLSLIHI